MKRSSVLIVLALVGVMFWTLPALAAPKALTESEMDSVTAAGQPEVLIAGSFATNGGITLAAGGGVSLTGNLTYDIALGTSAQQDLRALVLNNIVGENAVATALNIQAANGAIQGGSQTNSVIQSWGSTVDIGASAGQAAGAGGTVTIGKCVFGPCGSANGGAAAAGKVLSIYSDEILIGSTVTKNPTKSFEINLGQQAQSELAALAVNNVVGQNMAATGINILSGGVNVVPGVGGNASVLPVGAAGASGTQTNTIEQWRGTPKARP